MRDHMLVNGSHMIPNKHAAFSKGAESKSSMEGKALVLPTLKELWLPVLVGCRKWNFILAEEPFVSMRNRNENHISCPKKSPTSISENLRAP